MGNKLTPPNRSKKQANNMKSNKKYNEDIIQKILALNIATRDEIKIAMDNVTNPNDLNQVTDYITAQNETKPKPKDNNDAPNTTDNTDNNQATNDTPNNETDNDSQMTDDAVYIMSDGVLYKINREDYNRIMQQQGGDNNPPTESEKAQQKAKQKEKEAEKKVKEDEESKQLENILNKHETKTELSVQGYIRQYFQCKDKDFMSKILRLCLEYYHISYVRVLSLAGNEFINKQSETLTFNECIFGYDLIAFYFSAKWCPPSLTFTSKVSELYTTAINNNIKLQIIFVSLDRSETGMMEYFTQHHGNYVAIPYGNEEKRHMLGKVFDCEYIPHLCVVNNGCNLVDRHGRKTVTENGDKFIETLCGWQESNMKICKEIEIIKKEKRIEEEIEDNLIKTDEDRDSMIIYGYIHLQCDILAFEWIMPIGIFNVCFDFYHVSYKKLLKLCGNKFIRQNGEKCTFKEGIKGYDMIGFYFSAIWCPPSKAFTPKLKQLYDIANKEKKKLQIIFISSDQSEDEMMNYFQKFHGDYLAIDFNDKARKELLGKVFQCTYIPHLCIVNDKCEMLDAAATNTVVKEKENAIQVWEKKKAKSIEEKVHKEDNDINDVNEIVTDEL
eukprot:470078_1